MLKTLLVFTLLLLPLSVQATESCKLVRMESDALKINPMDPTIRTTLVKRSPTPGTVFLCHYSSEQEVRQAVEKFDADPLAKYDIYKCYRTLKNNVDLRVCPSDDANAGPLFLKLKSQTEDLAKDAVSGQTLAKGLATQYGFERVNYMPVSANACAQKEAKGACGRDSVLVHICKKGCEGE